MTERPFERFVDKCRKEARDNGADEVSYALGSLETEAAARFRHLFKQIAEPSFCKSCHAEVYWVTHKNGKKCPYTVDGLSHFVDCPASGKWRKK